jgi:FkbM family methyltransferase
MKLRHWLQFILSRDTTWHGQFRALRPLLLEQPGVPLVVVDVGANDGFYSSNSYPFIHRGWRAILIEPHPEAFAKASKLHRNNPRVVTLNLACGDAPGELGLQLYAGDECGSHSALATDGPGVHENRVIARTLSVAVVTLETVLEQHGVPENFGLLSIDTEGYDLRVIQGLNLVRFRPRVIITEKGADEEAKAGYLKEHGYRLHRSLDYDTIWTTPHAEKGSLTNV